MAVKKESRSQKARWFLAILGLACLGGGYGIAVMIESPLSALNLFFVAIILVILGTYFLFTAGSIALLKFLKRNERFYYKTNHFISVSSMMYRMKQNAAGLASICILSTMVLVTAATTASLFFGQKDVENTRYPREVMVSTVHKPELVEQAIETISAEKQAQLTKQVYLTSTKSIMFQPKNGNYQTTSAEDFYNTKSPSVTLINFMTAQEYEKHTSEKPNLKDDEIYFYPVSGDIKENTLKLENQDYKIKKRINQFPGINQQVELTDSFVVVLANQAVLERCLADWFPKQSEAAAVYPEYNFLFNTKLKEKTSRVILLNRFVHD